MTEIGSLARAVADGDLKALPALIQALADVGDLRIAAVMRSAGRFMSRRDAFWVRHAAETAEDGMPLDWSRRDAYSCIHAAWGEFRDAIEEAFWLDMNHGLFVALVAAAADVAVCAAEGAKTFDDEPPF